MNAAGFNAAGLGLMISEYFISLYIVRLYNLAYFGRVYLFLPSTYIFLVYGVILSKYSLKPILNTMPTQNDSIYAFIKICRLLTSIICSTWACTLLLWYLSV